MVKGKRGIKEKHKKFNFLTIIPIAFFLLLLVFITINFVIPYFTGVYTGKAITGTNYNPYISPSKTSSSSETKTLSEETLGTVNGVDMFITKAIQTSSADFTKTDYFASFIIGSKINNLNKSSFTIAGKTYSVELISNTNNSATIKITNSSGTNQTITIGLNDYSLFSAFTETIKIHYGGYIAIGNKEMKRLLQPSTIYRNASGNAITFLELTSGQYIDSTIMANFTYSSAGLFSRDGSTYNSFLEGGDIVKGIYLEKNSVKYNVSVVSFGTGTVFYEKPTGISIFVAGINQSSVSILIGSEMFLGYNNKKNNGVLINGKNYAIELKSAVTYTSATINVSTQTTVSSGGGLIPTTPGAQKNCKSSGQTCTGKSTFVQSDCCSNLRCASNPPLSPTAYKCRACVQSGKSPQISTNRYRELCCSNKWKWIWNWFNSGYVCV